eukprot:UN04008
MYLALILLILWCIVATFADEKKLLDLADLAPLCYEPDPFNIDDCFESCDPSTKTWQISLGEVDFDPDLDATVFTYVVDVWELGVCRESMVDNSNYDVMDGKDDNTNVIGGLYIMFNGCCNNSAPVYFTKAITPKHKFEFLKAGWYWEAKVSAGYQTLFGVMIYGNVELTKGTYCVRTGYHCICQPIAVPDLCNNKWNHTKDRHWAETESSDHQKSVDKRPVYGKHYKPE